MKQAFRASKRDEFGEKTNFHKEFQVLFMSFSLKFVKIVIYRFFTIQMKRRYHSSQSF